MQKIYKFLALFLATTSWNLSADLDDCYACDEPTELCCSESNWCNLGNWGVEAKLRAAYFYPTEKLFREIYTDNLCEYQLEVSKDLWGPTVAWLNVGWFSKQGRSIGLNEKTRISLLPVSFGASYRFFLTSYMNIYLGAGVSYVYVQIKDDSDFVQKNNNKGSWGGVLKTGMQYYFTPCFFGDVFADYQYNHVKYSGHNRHNAEVGGYKIGVGLGVRF